MCGFPIQETKWKFLGTTTTTLRDTITQLHRKKTCTILPTGHREQCTNSRCQLLDYGRHLYQINSHILRILAVSLLHSQACKPSYATHTHLSWTQKETTSYKACSPKTATREFRTLNAKHGWQLLWGWGVYQLPQQLLHRAPMRPVLPGGGTVPPRCPLQFPRPNPP